MPLFEDPDEEIREIERQQARRTTRRTPDTRTVRIAERWAREAPWMKPDAVLQLAKKGIGPGSKQGRDIMRAGAKVKKKSGLGWHSIGDVVSGAADFVTPEVVEDVIGKSLGVTPAGRAAGRAVKGAARLGAEAVDFATPEIVEDVVGGGVKGAVRGTFTLLQTPAELLDAEFRTTLKEGMPTLGLVPELLGVQRGRSHRIAEQTSGGQALFEGKGLGSGFFPGGEAFASSAEAAREYGVTIDGSGATPGRWLASKVFEPGTTPYNVLSGLVDAGQDIVDPAAVAGGALGRGNQASRLFDAGAVSGVRNTVLPEVVDGWLASPQGRKVIRYMTDETDFDTLWKRTKQKLGAKTTLALADARSEDDVLRILKPQLGVEILEKPTLGRLPTVRRRMDRVRLLQTMPGSHIDPNDIDDAVKQIDRLQKNAKLPADVIARNNRAMAESNTPTEVFDVLVNKVMKDSVNPRVGKFTKLWSNYHSDFARYFVDDIGENVDVAGAVIDGAGKALPTPHLYVEYLNGSIPLPDARAMRRATSKMGRWLENHEVIDDLGVALPDAFMQEFWKPMVLLRGAWTVRVVGEEQIRMAAAGLSSVFSHPLSHIADLAGKRGASGITDDVLRESAEGTAALSRGSGGFRGRHNLINTRYKKVYARGEERFVESWAEELQQLHADPVARRLVTGLGDGDATPRRFGNPLEDVKEWFFDGAGRKFRKEMAEANGRDALLTREGADAYVDSVMRRIKIKSGEHSDVLDLIGRGVEDGGKLDRSVLDRLSRMAEDGIGPEKVKGDVWLHTRSTASGKIRDRWDRATEYAFNGLMSRPTNYLSRSPSFRQYYWQRVETLLPSMDDAAKAKALKNAEKAGLPSSDLAALKKAAAKKGAEGRALSLADADQIAKGYGLDKTRELLYDLSERSQFFDINRIIFPFGEAWKELLTRWAKLGMENPAVPRRAQQVIQGARGSGFFYENENGEEVFAYPGSAWLSEKLIGAPIPFTGRVAGLSLMTEVLPGVGPVVQIPAGQFLPETPAWDGVREILMPFGERDENVGFIESQLPAWLQKLRTSGLLKNVPGVNVLMGTDDTQERLLNNTAMDLYAWQVSSGERKRPQTLEDIQDGVEANMDKARWLYVIRGGAQFFAPTAPSPQHVAMDKDGNVQVATRMRDDLYALQNGDPEKGIEGLGFEAGFQAWLDKYGEAAYLLSQPKSNSLVYGAPVTTDGVKWEREHPDVRKKFPNTYGFFAPTTGDFDYTAYARQFRTNQREAITPEQAVQLANNRIASHLYAQARDVVGPRPSAEDRAWLREVKDALKREYYGFDMTVRGTSKKIERKDAIAELMQAVKNPTVAGTDAGQGLAKYLKARQIAVEAGDTPTSFQRAKKHLADRDWLRDIAAALIEEHPSFEPLWLQVFEVELAEDTEE